MAYSWPGNIRELQHVMERAVILSTGNLIREDAFDGSPRSMQTSVSLNSFQIEEMEKQLVQKNSEIWGMNTEIQNIHR